MHMLVADAPPASASLLNYILEALGPDRPRPLLADTGLPAGALECPENNLIVAAKVASEPPFDDALLRLAAAGKRDVLLIRHGVHPEAGEPVRVDVAVRTIAGPLLISGMSFFRHAGGGLHLLPARPDLFVEVGVLGLDLSMLPPWDSWDERERGVDRAAAEIRLGVAGRLAWIAASREHGA